MNDIDVFFKGFEHGSTKTQQLSLSEYITRYIKIRNSDKIIPYSFDGHAYLRELSRVNRHKDVVVIKAAQIGYSTWMIARMFYLLDGTSRKAVMYFPDDENMKLFVQDRVYTLIEESDYVKSKIDFTDSTYNVKLIKFGKSTLAFRSTFTKKGVKSYDADILVLDEFDEHNAENILFADDRLLHSDDWYRMSGSQPSIEKFGIHGEFIQSDERYWLMKCDSCNHWNNLVLRFLEQPESIFGFTKTGECFYQCEKCGQKLNNQKGEFVPTRKHDRAGYQISQLFSSIIKPIDVYKKFKNANTSMKRKNFMISIIGWCFSTDEERPITQAVIDRNRGEFGLTDSCETFSYHGADQGDTIHAVFGEPTTEGKIKIIGLYKGHIVDEESYKEEIKKFRVYSGIVDAGPNKNWSLKMALTFPDNIKIQYFTKNYREGIEDVIGDEIEKIQVNRDESLQDTVDAVRNGMFIFPKKELCSNADLLLLEEFDFHLTMLVKELGEDENGKPTFKFKKKVPNHFGMALNSLRLALETAGSYDPGVVYFG